MEQIDNITKEALQMLHDEERRMRREDIKAYFLYTKKVPLLKKTKALINSLKPSTKAERKYQEQVAVDYLSCFTEEERNNPELRKYIQGNMLSHHWGTKADSRNYETVTKKQIRDIVLKEYSDAIESHRRQTERTAKWAADFEEMAEKMKNGEPIQ